MAKTNLAHVDVFTRLSKSDCAVIESALAILESRLKDFGPTMPGSHAVRRFLELQLGAFDREVFAVMFLNSQQRLISFDILFEGTLRQATVYPREVARAALKHNAASLILAHNHPSGVATPSANDVELTHILKDALALVDVEVLDHVIVGRGSAFSFAENKMMAERSAAAIKKSH